MVNIVQLVKRSENVYTTDSPIWQYDNCNYVEIPFELPYSYTAEFSNTPIEGEAAPIVQTGNLVKIPPEYTENGSPVCIWIVFVDETCRLTKKMIVANVTKRCKPTDYHPTPEQQIVIDSYVAALNQAIQDANIAVSHYPVIIDNYWNVWDVENGEWISTGVCATGNGIASAVLNADYTLTLTFTDGTSYTTPSIRGAQGPKGEKGDTGAQGPQGETGPQGATGEQGPKGDTGNSGVYVGTTEPSDPAQNVWINPNGTPSPYVQDVQVNNVSIVTNGIANVLMATVAETKTYLGIS